MAILSHNNKDKLILDASLLMADQGYDGFTMDGLLLQTGIAKSNAYYHFPTKELLGLEVLQFWCEIMYQFENTTLNSHVSTSRVRMDQWQQKTILFQTRSDFVGAIPDQLANQINSKTSLELFQRYIQKRHACLVRFLDDGKQHSEFLSSLNSSSMAWLIIDLISGAVSNSRIFRDREPLLRAFSQINSLIITPFRS